MPMHGVRGFPKVGAKKFHSRVRIQTPSVTSRLKYIFFRAGDKKNKRKKNKQCVQFVFTNAVILQNGGHCRAYRPHPLPTNMHICGQIIFLLLCFFSFFLFFFTAHHNSVKKYSLLLVGRSGGIIASGQFADCWHGWWI